MPSGFKHIYPPFVVSALTHRGYAPDPVALVPFTLQEHAGDGIVVLAPEGELDVATTGRLDARVEALTDTVWALVLDFRRLTFIDSSGLRSLLMASQRCGDTGTELIVLSSERVERVIEVAKLGGQLPLRQVETLSPAVQRLAGQV
jgi:anti-anti-sigma factor